MYPRTLVLPDKPGRTGSLLGSLGNSVLPPRPDYLRHPILFERIHCCRAAALEEFYLLSKKIFLPRRRLCSNVLLRSILTPIIMASWTRFSWVQVIILRSLAAAAALRGEASRRAALNSPAENRCKRVANLWELNYFTYKMKRNI